MMIEREPVPTAVIPTAAPVVVADAAAVEVEEVVETVTKLVLLLNVLVVLELDIGAV